MSDKPTRVILINGCMIGKGKEVSAFSYVNWDEPETYGIDEFESLVEMTVEEYAERHPQWIIWFNE